MADQVFRMEVWYSGRVQGVGFRYQASRVARGYEVTGRVVNLADGRVEMVAEGAESEVRAFAEAVGEALAGYIRQTEQRGGWGARSTHDFTMG